MSQYFRCIQKSYVNHCPQSGTFQDLYVLRRYTNNYWPSCWRIKSGAAIISKRLRYRSIFMCEFFILTTCPTKHFPSYHFVNYYLIATISQHIKLGLSQNQVFDNTTRETKKNWILITGFYSIILYRILVYCMALVFSALEVHYVTLHYVHSIPEDLLLLLMITTSAQYKLMQISRVYTFDYIYTLSVVQKLSPRFNYWEICWEGALGLIQNCFIKSRITVS